MWQWYNALLVTSSNTKHTLSGVIELDEDLLPQKYEKKKRVSHKKEDVKVEKKVKFRSWPKNA
jgi:hypothetical protein